jgi:hypothetical protein
MPSGLTAQILAMAKTDRTSGLIDANGANPRRQRVHALGIPCALWVVARAGDR